MQSRGEGGLSVTGTYERKKHTTMISVGSLLVPFILLIGFASLWIAEVNEPLSTAKPINTKNQDLSYASGDSSRVRTSAKQKVIAAWLS